MAKKLSKTQLEFLRKMRAGEPIPRTLTNPTAVSLRNLGIIQYAMMIGWRLTSAGHDVIAAYKDQLDELDAAL